VPRVYVIVTVLGAYRLTALYSVRAAIVRLGKSRPKGLTITKKLLVAVTPLILSVIFISSSLSTGYCSSIGISTESLLQKLREKQGLFLVDVRNAEEFEKFRIPGSINIPLFAVKTKTFLKSRPLVLMNEGHRYKQLTDECSILSKMGFAVSILNGGLNQWKRKGGPLEGDVFAQRELNRISSQEFFAGKGDENWIVVDVTQSGNRGTDPRADQNFQRIHIPFANNPREFIPKLESAIKNRSGNKPGAPAPPGDFVTVVICDESGKIYEDIEKHLQAAAIQNVLYLEGGLKGYQTFEKQQASMQGTDARAGKTVKTNKNCTSCP